MKLSKSRKGVTLMEILVVLVIMGMLSLIAMPTFFSFTKNTRLKGAARVISSALRNARSYAITQRINYAVAIYLTENAVSVYETPDSVKRINVSNTEIIDIRSDKSITGTSYTDAYIEFIFKPDGTTTNSTNSVWVYDRIIKSTENDISGTHYIQIEVYSTTGSVKIGDIDTDI